MPFFVCQKVQISSKILPQIPSFARASLQCTILVSVLNFAKNQYFGHYSRPPIFVISSVFHQKQNHLEPTHTRFLP